MIGDRYTLEIARELFYGNHRFTDMAAQLGAPRSVLSNRLAKLCDAGVIRRRQYSDRPPREEYLLTESGRDLVPLLLALKQWGDRWCRGDVQTVEFTHRCGDQLHVETVCSACRKTVQFEDLTVSGGTHPPTLTNTME
ncbi:winged helix-turn-helix transcriptional regulator [Rhodococcus wratislaviensis]|uniref:Putative HxlR family transcriptional regulator n=1 Tax=Rhodococcus wratislaviensis NBRC 100605 TaxID=1219028 RepID=X0PY15_RHOWR|nr:helix-turn-helix domain-containing protein [Rhodococcus wratislaviensis]GAF48323.1 putative HxlR family transcriptional regulator [Rhodococcus wratislaviensis NBRC 100605]